MSTSVAASIIRRAWLYIPKKIRRFSASPIVQALHRAQRNSAQRHSDETENGQQEQDNIESSTSEPPPQSQPHSQYPKRAAQNVFTKVQRYQICRRCFSMRWTIPFSHCGKNSRSLLIASPWIGQCQPRTSHAILEKTERNYFGV